MSNVHQYMWKQPLLLCFQINGQSYLMVVPKPAEKKVTQPPPPQSISVLPSPSQGVEHVFSNTGSYFVAQTVTSSEPSQVPRMQQQQQQQFVSTPQQRITQQIMCKQPGSGLASRIQLSTSKVFASSSERLEALRAERKAQRQSR